MMIRNDYKNLYWNKSMGAKDRKTEKAKREIDRPAPE
jgi:hypothetical protein